MKEAFKHVINIRIMVTFSLVVMFFLGGVFLDYKASQRSIDLGASDVSNKVLVEFATKAVENLSTSAKVLYDFSKVALGVLLTLLASSRTVARASQPTPGQPEKTEA